MGLNIGGIKINDPFKSGVSWNTVGLGNVNKWVSKNPIKTVIMAIAAYYGIPAAYEYFASASAAGTLTAGEVAAGEAALTSAETTAVAGGGSSALVSSGAGGSTLAQAGAQAVGSYFQGEAVKNAARKNQSNFEKDLAYKKQEDYFENRLKLANIENQYRAKWYDSAMNWRSRSIDRAARFGAPGQRISQKPVDIPALVPLPRATNPMGSV